jgi:ABC-type nickel/cobalt efflux system permease component RcnA
LLSLLVAFGFGALHALGPGHGKSVVAAYLVGSRGTPRHALGLGLTVTATHTAAVYGLGLVTLVASDLVAPEHMFLYLGVVSGALIVLMGGFLLVSRVRGVLRPRDVEEVHRHGLFGAKHSHLPTEHDHAHAHAPARASGGWYRQPARWNAAPGHVHEHGHDARVAAEAAGPASNVTWRGLVTLGIAGGLIPCPSALVVMLAAISLGQVLFGMALIVAFSFGLAGVLVAIGMALVLGRRLSGRRASRIVQRPIVAWALAALPIVSAAAVTLAGIAITYQAWNQPGI